jgi:cytochrome P450
LPSTESNSAPLVYDPYDYELDRNPHPVFKRMRDEAPIYYNPKYDFWALSRFDDVVKASLDHDSFSSARSTVLEMIGEELVDPPMIFMDPPKHTGFRKVVGRTFTPRRMATLEGRIRDLCAGYLDPLLGASEFDYLTEFGAKLPVMVVSSLLGVPEEDQDQLRIWTDQTLHREPGETGTSEAALAAGRDVLAYWASQIDSKRRKPKDDVMSDLVRAKLRPPDGPERLLTDGELFAFCMLISSAGNETVARFLGWAITLLAGNPGERDKLVANPALIENAVEEILRYEAPSPIQARYVTRDVEFYGTKVPQGSKIALLTASANRDEREFDDADRLNVERKIQQHLSLGFGVHFCLGASLARLEARVALEETLRRFPSWEVEVDRLEMVHTSTVRGYAKVPIRPARAD